MNDNYWKQFRSKQEIVEDEEHEQKEGIDYFALACDITRAHAALTHREICPGWPICVHCPECDDYPLDDVEQREVEKNGHCSLCHKEVKEAS